PARGSVFSILLCTSASSLSNRAGRLRRSRARGERRPGGARRLAPPGGGFRPHPHGGGSPGLRGHRPHRPRGEVTGEGYQGISRRWRKKPPVGPPSGRVASQTAVSAPFSTGTVAFGPPISVLTQPGHMALTRMLVPRSSSAKMRVRAFRAPFET